MSEKNITIWNRNFILLLVSNALLWMSFEMLTPTLPLYIEKIGGSPFQIGLIMGILTLSAMLVRMFTGSLMYLLDKKYILLISLLIGALATASYSLSAGLILLFFLRVVHGFGFGAATVYFTTLTAENLPEKRLGEGMGYFGIGESVCLSVGPVLGIMALYRFDYGGLFASSAFIAFLGALFILGLKRRLSEQNSQPPNRKHKISMQIIEKRVLPQSIFMLLNGIICGGVISFVAVFANKQGIPNVAWFFFLSAIVGVVVRIACGKFYDLKGPVFVLVPTGVIMIASMLLIAYSHSLLLLNIAGVFYGIGQSSLFSALLAWTMNLVETESRESAMSSILNSFDLGVGGGSLLLGLFIQFTSYRAMYFLLAGIATFYVMLLFYFANRQKALTQEGSQS